MLCRALNRVGESVVKIKLLQKLFEVGGNELRTLPIRQCPVSLCIFNLAPDRLKTPGNSTGTGSSSDTMSA
jgi:hypothetical protein